MLTKAKVNVISAKPLNVTSTSVRKLRIYYTETGNWLVCTCARCVCVGMLSHVSLYALHSLAKLQTGLPKKAKICSDIIMNKLLGTIFKISLSQWLTTDLG